jgi:hypothetical protein
MLAPVSQPFELARLLARFLESRKEMWGDLFTKDKGMILKIRKFPESPAILHKLKPEA